ncbi:NADH dehydrogenase [ubiquinone] 1 beta subcomplex subunit 4 [Galendromus occidentalis]|uniref:NADH dehydrogenase [ubiquinone] 1 beta subcomplex subunit 4 n=1 Tax=Galendromus occidentalis TaxID=34638 RepID=A0AAJ6QXX3_9ACAR|nr:NADH dehydrogenase [ubiquinone] 1 beta subcomplex subunit 4 [Galendromus occidentalis]
MAHRIPSEFALENECTADQKRIIAERAKIRQALRKEYILKVMDPHGPPGPVMDPAILRWQAARAAHFEYYKPSAKGRLLAATALIFPIALFTYLSYTDRVEFDRKCRSGEIPYEKRLNKNFW